VIKHSWLSADAPTLPNVSDHFVFQVGDLVLYFPAGHYDFLKVHPDPRAKKGKLKLRQPLWERANSAKEKKPAGIVSTDDKETHDSSQNKPDAATESTLTKNPLLGGTSDGLHLLSLVWVGTQFYVGSKKRLQSFRKIRMGKESHFRLQMWLKERNLRKKERKNQTSLPQKRKRKIVLKWALL